MLASIVIVKYPSAFCTGSAALKFYDVKFWKFSHNSILEKNCLFMNFISVVYLFNSVRCFALYYACCLLKFMVLVIY